MKGWKDTKRKINQIIEFAKHILPLLMNALDRYMLKFCCIDEPLHSKWSQSETFFQQIFGWRYRLPHFNFVLNRLFWLNYEFGGGFPLSFTIWLLKSGFPRALQLEVSCICDSLALLKRVASPHISVLLLLCVFVSVYCFKMSVSSW